MTAIKLHDARPALDAKQDGAIRHRTASTAATAPPSDDDADPWLQIPHDDETSKVPLQVSPFAPTAVYWITPDSILTSTITAVDLSKDMQVPYSGMTNEFKAQVAKTLQDRSYSPVLTCTGKGWFGMAFDVTDHQNNKLAHWSHPWSSHGDVVLTFPQHSPHSSHPITLQNSIWSSHREAFTVNSQPYFWEPENRWFSTAMTLYKVTGSGGAETKVEIGKYAQKWWCSMWTGGTLVVDTKAIDGIVACLTLIVVLKKKSQRAIEITSASAA